MATEVTKTIYVGGFSQRTSQSVLLEAFSPFGEVIDLQLPSDPASKNKYSHRGFAFISYSSTISALDAVDNMHMNVISGYGNEGKVLKVNLSKTPKGIKNTGSNRAVWEDEAWIKENGTEAPASFAVGTEGGASENQ